MKKIRGTDLRAAVCAVGMGALTWLLYLMGKAKGESDAYGECAKMLEGCIETAKDESAE